MDQMAIIRQTFFQECEEQLQALDEGLTTMEAGETSSELINAVFRAVHSIKGGAGAFKLVDLVSFSHAFETVLDHIRSGDLSPSQDIIRVLLRSADQLADLVSICQSESEIDPKSYEQLLNELGAIANSARASDAAADFENIDFTPMTIEIGAAAAVPAEAIYKIAFSPMPALLLNGNEPLLIFRHLQELGTLTVDCDISDLPHIDELQVDGFYLKFNLTLQTAATKNEIMQCFEFVEDLCKLSVEQAPHPVVVRALTGQDDSASDVEQESSPAVLSPEEEGHAPGEDDRAKSGANAEAADAQAGASAEAKDKSIKASVPSTATIRVDLDRLDRLINLVGELVINQAILAQRVGQTVSATGTDVFSSLEELERLTRGIQDSVMAIRAQPVKSLFQRMGRIVREVAQATGKSVRLRTEGEATELDKTVVESLADPLTHMIRNAVDHGLEAPEDREKNGKALEGTVRLTAAHQSGRVVITVSDDGAGINRPKVFDIAKRKGLIPDDAQLTEPEIDNLLFLPGFSTATEVSAISGRGVGMDVVRRSIQALGGRISISSKYGQGSTFTMSLPLTLAVLDGIVVSVAGAIFVIPLTSVVETLRPEAQSILPLGQGSYGLRVRERIMSVVDVGRAFGIRVSATHPTDSVAILVDTEAHTRRALLVDEIIDQRQVVIKSLESHYGNVPGIAAATILGDGRVAMILDVETITDSMQGEKSDYHLKRAV